MTLLIIKKQKVQIISKTVFKGSKEKNLVKVKVTEM